VGDEGKQDRQEAVVMAPVKETDRARQKGSTERVDSRRGRRSVAQEIGRGGEPSMVDIDPWGTFFEDFWEEAAEGGSADRHEGERKRPRAPGRRP
jgi:hypothetical protein